MIHSANIKLLNDLQRPVYVWRQAVAKGDNFPGAKKTRENAEKEIEAILSAYRMTILL